jgi:hypothetical protein
VAPAHRCTRPNDRPHQGCHAAANAEWLPRVALGAVMRYYRGTRGRRRHLIRLYRLDSVGLWMFIMLGNLGCIGAGTLFDLGNASPPGSARGILLGGSRERKRIFRIARSAVWFRDDRQTRRSLWQLSARVNFDGVRRRLTTGRDRLLAEMKSGPARRAVRRSGQATTVGRQRVAMHPEFPKPTRTFIS